jgi:hypothetical protein
MDECDPCDPCAGPRGYKRLDLLAGYCFFGFRDRITINENLFPLGAEFVPGTNIRVRDDFQAENWFHGIMIGLAAERSWGKCYVAGEAKVSLGATVREVVIDGVTIVHVPGDVPSTGVGGLLALPSNIGTYRSCEFTAIPEFDFRVGYQFTPGLRGFVGYTLIIWPDVARAGEQIDPVVNPFLIPPPLPNPPGPARPAFMGHTSTLLVQGLSLGLEYRW